MFDALPKTVDHSAQPAIAAASAAAELNLSSRAMKEEYLNRDLEVELSLAWRVDEDLDARRRLIMSHQRLATKMVHKMKRRKDSENDLMQEASFGLMRAADKYDPFSGNRFATYAKWWICAAIQEAIMRDNGSVRLKSSSVNRTAFYTLFRIEAQAERIMRRKGIEPTQENLRQHTADLMGIDVETLDTIKATIPSNVSLNEPAVKSEAGEMGAERIDMIPSRDPNPEEMLIQESSTAHASNLIAQAMSCLNEREMITIRERKMSLEPKTLEDLSGEFGVSRERVRQIESRALGKMREALAELGITSMDFLSVD